jgi:hypothetical protein
MLVSLSFRFKRTVYIGLTAFEVFCGNRRFFWGVSSSNRDLVWPGFENKQTGSSPMNFLDSVRTFKAKTVVDLYFGPIAWLWGW